MTGPSLPGWMVHRLASASARLADAGAEVTPVALARAAGLNRRAAARFLAQGQRLEGKPRSMALVDGSGQRDVTTLGRV